jgi:hypothetical protein
MMQFKHLQNGENTMRTKLTKIALTAALAVATAFTLSCSDSGGNGGGGDPGGNAPIKKTKISGVFQKGPFVEGTTATLNELDSGLNPTGRPYQTLITDDKGTFEIRNVELVSPYAHLIANGFYRNEVTGAKSAAPITLQAIVDVTDKDNVNVNILTHIEYYRVLDLVDGGMTVKAAKKQAQKEILAVFGIDSDVFKSSEDMTIFGATESDAALLAVSILLLGDLSEADFTQRLMNLSQAIRTGGVWNDETAKSAMAKWAVDAGLNDMLAKVKSNILGWGLATAVPGFEKFVGSYWVANLCSENNCFTDTRDGNTYRLATVNNATVMIDWMRYRGENGNLGTNSKFTTYTWGDAQNICPAGWRLPNDTDTELFIACTENVVFSDPHLGRYWFNGQTGSFGNDGSGYKWYGGDVPPTASIYCIKN